MRFTPQAAMHSSDLTLASDSYSKREVTYIMAAALTMTWSSLERGSLSPAAI